MVFQKKNITKLQVLQNLAARVLMRTRKRVHITPILRIDFKILLLLIAIVIPMNHLQPSGPLVAAFLTAS